MLWQRVILGGRSEWMACQLRHKVWERASQAEIFRRKSPSIRASMYIIFHCEMEEREAIGIQRRQMWQFTAGKRQDVVMERGLQRIKGRGPQGGVCGWDWLMPLKPGQQWPQRGWGYWHRHDPGLADANIPSQCGSYSAGAFHQRWALLVTRCRGWMRTCVQRVKGKKKKCERERQEATSWCQRPRAKDVGSRGSEASS